MGKTFLLFLIIFFTGLVVGYLIFTIQNSEFKNLNAEEMYKRIINEREYAIGKAIETGVYKCCINPPCTMCYMEANQWNNWRAGTCACDDLVAQGKEPCPQCQEKLCGSQEGSCNPKTTE